MEVLTLTGSGVKGFKNGLLNEAKFNYPNGIAINEYGNILVADTENNKIRHIDIENEEVITLAGSDEGGFNDGPVKRSKFNGPMGVAIYGNIFIADTGNSKIRYIVRNQDVKTLNVTNKDLHYIRLKQIAFDRDGNLFASDGESRIIFINMSTQKFTILSGSTQGFEDGTLKEAKFYLPSGIAIDGDGNIVVADAGNHRIRHINMRTGGVTTLAGSDKGFKDGMVEEAQFDNPNGIAIDGNGNIIVADTRNNRIRLINMKTRQVITLAGSDKGFKDGDALTEARFNGPMGIAIYEQGDILVTDRLNHAIRIIKNVL